MRYISNFVQNLTKLFRFKRSVIKGNSVSSSVKEEVVENNCDDLLKEKGYEFTKGERVNFIIDQEYCIDTFKKESINTVSDCNLPAFHPEVQIGYDLYNNKKQVSGTAAIVTKSNLS